MRCLVVLALLAAPLSAQEATVVQESVNEHAALPSGNGNRFQGFGIGWYWTPQTSFYVSAISSYFTPDGPNGLGAFSIWTDAQAFGGTELVGSGGSVRYEGGWATFPLASTFQINALTEYLIVLGGNIDENGSNFTRDPDATRLRTVTSWHSSLDGASTAVLPWETAPVLRFEGPTVSVPEPSSLLLLASGMLGLGYTGRRRRAGSAA